VENFQKKGSSQVNPFLLDSCLFFPYSVNFVRTHRKTAMTIEKRKLELIKRVMKIEKSASLKKIEESIIEEEMKQRMEESMEDIKAGRVHTLEEFKQMNEAWMKEKGWV